METHHQPQKNTENDVQKKTDEGVPKPPSPSSSPSHEFSFTISLHSSNATIHDKSKTPPSLAVDLSPADDIFFHGHLLPLHLLSHFSSSPRFSTNSVDSFTLPIRDFLEDEKRASCNSSSRSNITLDSITNSNNREDHNNRVTKEESKSKPSFSLFGLSKGRKGCQLRDKEDKENSKHKKKLGYDVMHALKKYLRMVQPLVLFRGKREKVQFHGQAYSHSGNLIRKTKPELRGRRGEFSAPASMRTSPSNSGLLPATAALPPSNDSTMEELQAAIQAAIAHCKNSIAKEEKLNC
ncbi:hypothetical protein VNO80_17823 [Phaseolus coccineus]|uniref:BRI1 kinase inhibitor 1 n=1 Tax=Phaseolus coccineus TaxID=3886 RepID=A0AAN9MI72_PHACN